MQLGSLLGMWWYHPVPCTPHPHPEDCSPISVVLPGRLWVFCGRLLHKCQGLLSLSSTFEFTVPPVPGNPFSERDANPSTVTARIRAPEYHPGNSVSLSLLRVTPEDLSSLHFDYHFSSSSYCPMVTFFRVSPLYVCSASSSLVLRVPYRSFISRSDRPQRIGFATPAPKHAGHSSSHTFPYLSARRIF